MLNTSLNRNNNSRIQHYIVLYSSISGRLQFTGPLQSSKIAGLYDQMMCITTTASIASELSTIGGISAADYALQRTNKATFAVLVIRNDFIHMYKPLLPFFRFLIKWSTFATAFAYFADITFKKKTFHMILFIKII